MNQMVIILLMKRVIARGMQYRITVFCAFYYSTSSAPLFGGEPGKWL